jgi:hypothetical protein
MQIKSQFDHRGKTYKVTYTDGIPEVETDRESPCRPRKRRREGRTIMQSIHDRPGRSLSLAFEEQPAWAGRWCLAPAKGPSGRLYAPQRAPGRRAG